MLYGDAAEQLPLKMGTSPPPLRPLSIVAKRSPISGTAELLYKRLPNKSSAVAEMGDRGHNRHRPKRGGGLLCPFRGSWDLVYYNVAWAEVYFRTKRRLHPSNHLAQ